MKAPRPLSDSLRVCTLKVALTLVVAAVQFGLIMALGLSASPAPVLHVQTPVVVTLVRRERQPDPDVEILPAATRGGGAPAAPSSVRLPAPRPVSEVEVSAPPLPAPLQPLVLGLATEAAPVPARGMGVEGEGGGEGAGDGDRPGRGGSPPMILRGASPSEVLSVVPPQARRDRQAGRASINCVIRLDETLDDCRIVSESPTGYGFGSAGLQASGFFRYRPPANAEGRPLEGQRVTISVLFGRQ